MSILRVEQLEPRQLLSGACFAPQSSPRPESDAGSPFPRVTLAGGASQSALWAQILADVLGKTVRVPPVPEASAVAGGRLILNVIDKPGSTAVAFYEGTGWRYTHTTAADWTGPRGEAVRLRHYVR